MEMETEQKFATGEGVNKRKDADEKDIALFSLSMRDLSNVTLVLPLSGLFVCLITG